jgi:hypothetical protein
VLAENHGDLPAALVLCGHAKRLSSNNVMHLCRSAAITVN